MQRFIFVLMAVCVFLASNLSEAEPAKRIFYSLDTRFGVYEGETVHLYYRMDIPRYFNGPNRDKAFGNNEGVQSIDKGEALAKIRGAYFAGRSESWTDNVPVEFHNGGDVIYGLDWAKNPIKLKDGVLDVELPVIRWAGQPGILGDPVKFAYKWIFVISNWEGAEKWEWAIDIDNEAYDNSTFRNSLIGFLTIDGKVVPDQLHLRGN